jgi:hypothetical protein
VNIPFYVAEALQADGWWLRSDIIWAKPNPMPESVTDRPTTAHEHVFLLTKASTYFYDAEAVREEGKAHQGRAGTFARDGAVATHILPGQQAAEHRSERTDRVPVGRNRRSVWTIATQPYPEAHFATFPEALVEPCVLAGTSAHGVCAECGSPWERVVERGELQPKPGRKPVRSEQISSNNRPIKDKSWTQETGYEPNVLYPTQTTGWRPTCDHEAPTIPAVVLDLFAGSGTVSVVAQKLGRHSVGVDLNPKYLALAVKRLEAVPLPLLPAAAAEGHLRLAPTPSVLYSR